MIANLRRINPSEYVCAENDRTIYFWRQTWHVGGYRLSFPVWHWADVRYSRTARFGYAASIDEATTDAARRDGWTA